MSVGEKETLITMVLLKDLMAFRCKYSRIALQRTPKSAGKKYVVSGPTIFRYVESGPGKMYVITVDTL